MQPARSFPTNLENKPEGRRGRERLRLRLLHSIEHDLKAIGEISGKGS